MSNIVSLDYRRRMNKSLQNIVLEQGKVIRELEETIDRHKTELLQLQTDAALSHQILLDMAQQMFALTTMLNQLKDEHDDYLGN